MQDPWAPRLYVEILVYLWEIEERTSIHGPVLLADFGTRYRVRSQVLLVFPVFAFLTVVPPQFAAVLAPPALDDEFLALFVLSQSGDLAAFCFHEYLRYAVLFPFEVCEVQLFHPHIIRFRYSVFARYARQLGYIGNTTNPYFPLLFEELGHHEELIAVGVAE